MTESDSLYLSFGLPDGTEHRVSLDPSRDGFRLAVGSVNRRSSIWRVWGAGNEGYIYVMGLNKTQKLSLHKSGTWRMAYLEGVAERLGASGKPEFNHDPRVIDRWEAPEGAAGWMHAFTVWVPHGHMTPLPDEAENPEKPIIWLPEPGEGEAVGIHFAVARPDEGTFDPAKMIPMAGFRLPSQRALIVLTSRRTNEPGRDQWLRDMAVYGLVQKQGNHVTHFGDPLRIGLFVRDDENRGVWDLRAPQREDLERVNREGLTVNRTFTPSQTGSKENMNDSDELTLLFSSSTRPEPDGHGYGEIPGSASARLAAWIRAQPLVRAAGHPGEPADNRWAAGRQCTDRRSPARRLVRRPRRVPAVILRAPQGQEIRTSRSG